MGVDDRDGPATGLTGAAKWGYLGVLAFWLVVMGVVYLAVDHFMQPQAMVVTADGDVRIPRSRDGHFYVDGSVNGEPIRFLVDTGASMVVVSEAFARRAGLSGGEPTTFHTANGTLQGRTVRGVAVEVGPLAVSSVRVGVGLVGAGADTGLLGQSFLRRFNMRVSEQELVLHP